MTPAAEATPETSASWEADVVALPHAWRAAAAVLRFVARGSLLVTLAVLLFSDNPPTNPLKQMRLFSGLFVAPEAAAWCIARAFAARLRVGDGALVVEQGDRRVEIPTASIAALEPWAIPLPSTGVALTLRSGRRYEQGLALADLDRFAAALVAGGAPTSATAGLDGAAATYARARLACPPGRLDHPLLKFVVYSLVPTVPVFRLHQIITYGGFLGEYYTFGLQAWLVGFAIWWVSWAIALVLFASVLRAAVEIGTIAAALANRDWATPVRRWLLVAARVLFYVGTPVWLLVRLR